MGSDRAAESPARRLARYTPASLSAAEWALAGPAVRATVLGADPSDAEDAKGLASRACLPLTGHAGWDRRRPPELAGLLTEAAITAHLDRLTRAGKAGKTRENHRADLRRPARAAAGLPPRPRGARRASDPAAGLPAGSAVLLSWLAAGTPLVVAATAFSRGQHRPLTRDVLEPVVAALQEHAQPGGGGTPRCSG